MPSIRDQRCGCRAQSPGSLPRLPQLQTPPQGRPVRPQAQAPSLLMGRARKDAVG